MTLPVGTRLSGKIIATGRTLPGWGHTVSIVQFDDGSQGYVGEEDLFSSNEDIEEDTHARDMLYQLAESFLGKEVQVVVIHHHKKGVIVGRKHYYPDPIGYLIENPTLSFEGVVLSVSPIAAKVLMDVDWEEIGYDKYCRVVGTLPQAECSRRIWNGVRKGSRIELQLGPCDFKNQDLLFVPA